MKEEIVKRLWFGITVVVVLIAFFASGAILGSSSFGVVSSVILGIIVANLSAVLWALWKKMQDKKAGFPHKDERIKIIEWRASYYALMVSMYFMLGLMWYVFLGVERFGLPELKTVPALILSIIVMALLFGGLRWYFMRKGDAQ